MSSDSGRRRPLIALGVALIVAGLVAATAMWLVAANRRSDTIAGFARAPVGCDTTLDFVEAGEYLVYVESAGRIDDVRGDCDVAGEYDAGNLRPDVDVVVVDPDGEIVELDAVGSEVTYDDDGFVGAAAFRVEIADVSDHVIRVESPNDGTFAVAIGPDPDDGVAALRLGGLIVAVGGIAAGVAAIVIGSRRRRFTSGDASTWAPSPPQHPATFVPGQAPTAPPMYGRPHGPPPGAGGHPPPPPRGDIIPSWQPPPPPAPPRSTPPPTPTGPPRIPGEPYLAPGSPWAIDPERSTQRETERETVTERDESATPDDHREMPPPG